MDYESKYNELVEAVRVVVYDNPALCNIYKELGRLRELLPEKESEDERIREGFRRLLNGIRRDGGLTLNKVPLDKCFAYLEKQKEQKVDIDKLRKDIYQSGYNDGYQMGLAKGRNEQKPAEKQDYTDLNDLERAILRGFLAAGVENVPVTIIKETAKECLAQMKHAGWSEEDRKKIANIIMVLMSSPVEYAEEIEFLKSLCPQPAPVLRIEL